MNDRRERIQSLVVALLANRSDLGFLEEEHGLNSGARLEDGAGGWLERNRQLVRRYQALVRTAVTLDALIEQEVGADQLGKG